MARTCRKSVTGRGTPRRSEPRNIELGHLRSRRIERLTRSSNGCPPTESGAWPILTGRKLGDLSACDLGQCRATVPLSEHRCHCSEKPRRLSMTPESCTCRTGLNNQRCFAFQIRKDRAVGAMVAVAAMGEVFKGCDHILHVAYFPPLAFDLCQPELRHIPRCAETGRVRRPQVAPSGPRAPTFGTFGRLTGCSVRPQQGSATFHKYQLRFRQQVSKPR